jgi:hypothetical protein
MWPQVLNVLLGVWLMTAPAVLAYGAPASTSSHVAGPLVASFAFVALWEVVRGLGRMNVLLGLWLLLAPAVLEHGRAAMANTIAAGLLVLIAAALPSRVPDRYGGGWSGLFRTLPRRATAASVDRGAVQ